jgi:hypothetical protein
MRFQSVTLRMKGRVTLENSIVSHNTADAGWDRWRTLIQRLFCTTTKNGLRRGGVLFRLQAGSEEV